MALASACGIVATTRKEARRELVARFGAAPLLSDLAKGPQTFHQKLVKEMRAMKKAEKQRVRGLHPEQDAFLLTYEWRRARTAVLKRDGARCACCGATPAHGVKMHVDHIKPRKFFPNLALTLDNLQVLCEECNHGKGNWDMTDWRAINKDRATTMGE